MSDHLIFNPPTQRSLMVCGDNREYEDCQVNILKLLLDSMASPALRNENACRWTALHAAALQEEGKLTSSVVKL